MLLRRMIFMLLGVIAVIAVLAGYKVYSIRQQLAVLNAPKPPISVTATSVETRPWQSRLSAVGSLKAIQGIEVTAEVSGTVKTILFQSGDKVTVGQPLIQLDGDVEEALLKTAEADLQLARLEFARGRDLIDSKAISKSEYDRLSSQSQKTTATVAQLKATLEKKHILAPFSGTTGIKQVDVGDYLSPGTPIVTLQDISALLLDFHLPEQTFPLLSVGQSVQLQVAAYPGETFPAQISAINPKVENETRNLQVRAELKNPQNKLLPGMFANIEVLLPGEMQRIVVPETSIAYTLYGDSVYVIKPAEPPGDQDASELMVERRFIQTGEKRSGLVVIEEGLNLGEQIVTSGQLKLDSGARVSIVSDAAMNPDS